MRPDGVNGSVPAQQAKLLPLNVDISNQEQLAQVLAGLSNNANNTINDALMEKDNEDANHITFKEYNSLVNIENAVILLKGKIDSALETAVGDIKTLYENTKTQLESLYDKLVNTYTKNVSTDYDTALAIREKNGKTNEPTEIDAQRPKHKTPVDLKQMSNNDIIAESEIIKQNLHIDGEMKRDYESCFTNIWGSGHKISQNDYGMIKSNLVKFQAKYTKELHNNNSFEKIDNYGKIETQISYYEELAARDTQKNKQEALNNSSLNPPSKEKTEAYYAAIKKELNKEGDPRANYSKETDFLNN